MGNAMMELSFYVQAVPDAESAHCVCKLNHVPCFSPKTIVIFNSALRSQTTYLNNIEN